MRDPRDVQEVSVDHLGRHRTDRGTLGEVRKVSGGPSWKSGRSRETIKRFEKCRGTLGDARDGSGTLGEFRE